ncbi:MAG: MFS transporter [Actinobacteria bacterium]|nr:MFS transporter [Actinomycetota bacterium]
MSPHPRRWEALPVILVATFMALFDVFVVNVAAPSLQRDLHASSSDLQLVVGGYSFSYAALLVTGGRLGDRYSYRLGFLGGMALFTIASLACGLATSPSVLIGARVVQGIGAAVMVPQVLALITALFPPEERTRALAWFGVAVGLGAIAGQILGGALVQVNWFGWGWRMVFAVNIPIGIATIALGARLLPRDRSSLHPQLDGIGVLGVTGALALALIPLTLGHDQGWPWWLVVPLCLSPLAFVAAARYERGLARRGGQPVLDLALFRFRSFSAGVLVTIGVFMYFGSVLLGLTLFLQLGLGLSALDAGLTFAPLGVSFALTSIAARRLVARYGPRVASAGIVVAFTALLVQVLDIHFSGNAIDAQRLAPVFFLVGIGNGLVIPSLIGVSLVDVAPNEAGAAAGTLATGQQFALAAGVAVLSEIFFTALGHHPAKHNYIHAIQYVFVLDIALLAASFAVSLLLPRPRRQPVPEPAFEAA